MDRLLRAGRDLLGWLLGRIVGSLTTFHGAWSLLAWLLVAAVTGGVLFLIRRAGMGVVPERRRPEEAYAARVIDWHRNAERALARGDLREAVRCLYHALLAALAARGVVEDAPSLTAGEARLAVGRRQPGLFPTVARATEVFERVTYGERVPTPDDVEDVRRASRLEGMR